MDAHKFPSMNPKKVFLHNNGTGRDTYVTVDNGGTVNTKIRSTGLQCKTKQIRTSMATKPHQMIRPRQDAKVVGYHSDGTGRDSYVIITSGGLKNETYGIKPESGFAGSLRNYPRLDPLIRPSRSISLKNRHDKASVELKQHLKQYYKSVDHGPNYNQQMQCELLSRPTRKVQSDKKPSNDDRRYKIRSGDGRRRSIVEDQDPRANRTYDELPPFYV